MRYLFLLNLLWLFSRLHSQSPILRRDIFDMDISDTFQVSYSDCINGPFHFDELYIVINKVYSSNDDSVQYTFRRTRFLSSRYVPNEIITDTVVRTFTNLNVDLQHVQFEYDLDRKSCYTADSTFTQENGYQFVRYFHNFHSSDTCFEIKSFDEFTLVKGIAFEFDFRYRREVRCPYGYLQYASTKKYGVYGKLTANGIEEKIAVPKCDMQISPEFDIIAPQTMQAVRSISVIDLNARVLKSPSEFPFSLQDLSPSVYVLKVQFQDNTFCTQKIVR